MTGHHSRGKAASRSSPTLLLLLNFPTSSQQDPTTMAYVSKLLLLQLLLTATALTTSAVQASSTPPPRFWCGPVGGRKLLSCRQDAPQVCGSDGVTYPNSCGLLMAQCKKPELKQVREGPCKPYVTPQPTPKLTPKLVVDSCEDLGLCNKSTKPTVTPSPTPRLIIDSCEDMGKCPRSPIPTTVRPTPTTAPPKPWCPNSGAKQASRKLLRCRSDAPKVCGSDGVTYQNSCALLMAQCSKPNLKQVCEGACKKKTTNKSNKK